MAGSGLIIVTGPNELDKQLSWHWENHLRPRLDRPYDGNTSGSRSPGCGACAQSGVATEVGAGDFVIDFASRAVTPAGDDHRLARSGTCWSASSVIGWPGISAVRRSTTTPTIYPSTAADALARLDDMYAEWIAGVRSLDDDGLRAPCGEPGFEQDPMAALVLHINREVIHHGAEICLLRDLYQRQH